MSSIPDLDDENQTVFFIPFAGPHHNQHNLDEDLDRDLIPLPLSLETGRDLIDHEHLRVKAYKTAWEKCLERVKSIIKALHSPVVVDIVRFVQASYEDVLPGLPYPELPVICIKEPLSSSTFLHNITSQLDSSDLGDNTLFDVPTLTTHLYPTDCANLTSAMKTMIAGFTDRQHILEKVKGRSAMSLANYDIEMLCAWYLTLRTTYELTEESQPNLIVVLHDFEQLDPLVIQDLFNISSLHVTRLPLVFILLLSSPSSPSHLHTAYSRSTLALLRIRTFVAPSGPQVLEDILLKTFFDVEFEPDIMIGPEVLLHLVDNFTRQNASLDAVLTILHLAHLKHFSGEPLTILVQSTLSHDILEEPASLPFLEALSARLQIPIQPPTSSNLTDWSKQESFTALVTAIDKARIDFCSRAIHIRLGFGLAKLIQEFLETQGYKGLGWNNQPSITIFDVMVDILRSNFNSEIKALGGIVKKLRMNQLSELLKMLHTYLDSIPSRSAEEVARAKLILFIDTLPQQRNDTDISEASTQLKSSFADWLVGYLKGLAEPLENAVLWDIWYTGRTQSPSDLVNPSMRASILSGLLLPHAFAEPNEDDEDNQVGFSLWEHPDTSILFRRYLDSGKMINVYDWFESFQLVIETQRKNLKKLEDKKKQKPQSSPKRGGRGRPSQKARDEDDIDGDEDEDTFRIQIQARFMRALHELDYLGFIKHTGRKADHVLRTVFDMRD